MPPLSRLTAALATAAVVPSLLLTGCGDDRPDRGDQAADAAADAGLPEDVQDFLRLAASATEATYEVTYEPSEQGVAVRVAQRPPDRRVDLSQGTGDEATVQSRFAVDGRGFVCTRTAQLPWECAEAEGPAPTVPVAFSEDDLEATADRLRASRERFDFEVREREVAGAPATCLVTTPTEGDGEAESLCLSDQGVPLLVEREGGRLEAASYDDDPAGDVFSLPAETG